MEICYNMYVIKDYFDDIGANLEKLVKLQGFHDLFYHYLCFFSKRNEYCKTSIWVNFSRFIKRCHLDDFHKYKMSMGLSDGEKHVAQIHTAGGKYVLKRIAIAYVVYSTRTGIRLN